MGTAMGSARCPNNFCELNATVGAGFRDHLAVHRSMLSAAVLPADTKV